MNNIDILEDLLSTQKQYIEDKDYQKEHNINEQAIDYAKMWTKATETLIAENKELKEENKKLNIIRLEMLLSQFPDSTETYKKYKEELQSLLGKE